MDINTGVRLNKYIADAGIASRRKADELISLGKVRINGKVVKELGVKVNPEEDRVEVEGRVIKAKSAKVYILYNKPVGVTSTTFDPHAEKTVVEAVDRDERVYPVGRLDKESRGLVLLTNDGELAFRLTHPKYHVAKTYLVTVKGKVIDAKVAPIRRGMRLDDEMTAPAQVRVLSQEEKQSVLEIVLFEGKKREIRRMCAELHLYVMDLQRVEFGGLRMDGLVEGAFRDLTLDEIKMLYKSVAYN
jgi:23S rRNA pseudouridine2605 synthase